TEYQHYDEEKYLKDELDKRECNLHISAIRRSIPTLHEINLDEIRNSDDCFKILSKMKDSISIFGNKRILLNLRRYLDIEYKFTHCLIDPNAAFSVIANFVPKADSNPGP